MLPHSPLKLAPVLAVLLLLGGVGADRLLFHLPPKNTDTYHRLVREAAADLPVRIGPWIASDAPLPRSAVALLHPNVALCRQLRDVSRGRTASFVLVQCADARDLIGHWPPICYAGHGWTLLSKTPKDWQVDDLLVQGMQYEFGSYQVDRPARLAVDDFMILPDGRTCRDMQGVDQVGKDPRKRALGAAQVQVVTDGSLSPQEREELTRMLIRAHRVLIDAIRRG